MTQRPIRDTSTIQNAQTISSSARRSKNPYLETDTDRDRSNFDRSPSYRTVPISRSQVSDTPRSFRYPPASHSSSLHAWARELQAERETQWQATRDRLAELKAQPTIQLSNAPLHLWWELVVLFLAALGISWGYIKFSPQLTEEPTPSIPSIAFQPTLPTSEPLSEPLLTLPSDDRKVRQKEEDALPPTIPFDRAKTPLTQTTKGLKTALNGIAKKLPPDLELPVKHNQRIAGYRVTDVFLPCQSPDSSDCRGVHPVSGAYNVPHWGVDVAMPYGAPLRAVGKTDTSVTVSCTYKAGGGLAAIMTSDSFPEYEFQALHLSDCLSGTYTAGEIVATVGTSGGVTGPHLHWEAKLYGRRIDPPRWSIEYVIKGDIVLEIPKKYTY
ncbi:MAG: M23 family metallopeptidase [Cyanobacteria bacterium SID2]|nr:M23 family metallopeptidase [Cyanobacteria bacterium SID2]